MSPIVTQSSRKNKSRNDAGKVQHNVDVSAGSQLRQRRISASAAAASSKFNDAVTVSPSSSPYLNSSTHAATQSMPQHAPARSISIDDKSEDAVRSETAGAAGTDSATTVSFWEYLRVPVSDGPMPTEATADEEGKERLRMLTLVRVPLHLESTLHYGLAVCLDSFLFYITLLPLRCVYALGLCVAALSRRACATVSMDATFTISSR